MDRDPIELSEELANAGNAPASLEEQLAKALDRLSAAKAAGGKFSG